MLIKAKEDVTTSEDAAEEFQWHAMTKEQACALLGVSENIRQEGMSMKEAQDRLDKYGFNQLTEKEKVTLLRRIWRQVNNVLVGILVAVAVVSLIKGITTKNTADRVLSKSA